MAFLNVYLKYNHEIHLIVFDNRLAMSREELVKVGHLNKHFEFLKSMITLDKK